MISVPLHRELISNIVTHLATQTGRPVGDAVAPDGVVVDGALTGSFAVVYPQPDRVITGPMDDGQADRIHSVTVMCAGETRYQAQWMADKVRAAMTTVAITAPAGRSISLVDEDEVGQVDRDDTFEVEAFYAPATFLVYTTPT